MKSTSAAGAGAVIRRPGAGAVVSKGVGGEERERQPIEKNARWRASRRGDRALPATLSTWPARPSWLAVGSRVIAGSRDLGRLRQGRGEARPGARAGGRARLPAPLRFSQCVLLLHLCLGVVVAAWASLLTRVPDLFFPHKTKTGKTQSKGMASVLNFYTDDKPGLMMSPVSVWKGGGGKERETRASPPCSPAPLVSPTPPFLRSSSSACRSASSRASRCCTSSAR